MEVSDQMPTARPNAGSEVLANRRQKSKVD